MLGGGVDAATLVAALGAGPPYSGFGAAIYPGTHRLRATFDRC